MSRQKSINKAIYTNYYAAAIINSLYTSMMPIYYGYLGMNQAQVGKLVSVVFLGAIIQPLFGFIADKTQQPKMVLSGLYTAILLCTTVLYFAESFQLIFIIVLLISVVRMPLFGLTDNLVLKYANEEGQNYGNLRKGGSLGWGFAMLIAAPFMLLFSVKAFIVIIMICSIISLITVQNMPYTKVHESHSTGSYLSDFKVMIKDKRVVALILFQTLLMGISALKFSYQAILLQDLTNNPLLPAVALIISTLPEAYLMQYYPHFEERFGVLSSLAFVVILNIVQFIAFGLTDNYIVLLLLSSLHGFGMAIYLPGFSNYLKRSVNPAITSTVFVVSSTIQSFYTLVVSSIIIAPIYADYGVTTVFITLGCFVALAIIPILCLFKIEQKQ